MSRKLGKYCHIQCQKTGFVLELQSKISGSSVILSVPRDEENDASSQLWFIDEQTQTIRSKWKGYCLEHNTKDDAVIIRQYIASRSSQKWVIVEGQIQTQDDFELVLGAPADDIGTIATVMENTEDQDTMWTFEPRPAQFFFLRSRKLKHKVLDVEKAKSDAGTKIIVWQDKGKISDNQLWYEDQQGIIRSKLTDFVIDATGKEVVAKPYDRKNKLQMWTYEDKAIRNMHDPTKVIALQQGKIKVIFYDTVTVQKYDGEEHQQWKRDYLTSEPAKFNHGGLGKYFHIKCFWNDIVLDLQDRSTSPGTAVVSAFRQLSSATAVKNTQLFYADQTTRTIRAQANDLCWQLSESGIITLNFYEAGNENQQWKVFGKKIQNVTNPTNVLTLQLASEAIYENAASASVSASTNPSDLINCHLIVSPFTNAMTQHFEASHVRAGGFYIRNVQSGKVLDIYNNDRSVGTKVLQFGKKTNMSENQLWYEDENGYIRSCMTGYVLHADSTGAKVMPYDPSSKLQHWIIVGDRIQSRHDPSQVLEGKWAGVISASFDAENNQRWTFEHV